MVKLSEHMMSGTRSSTSALVNGRPQQSSLIKSGKPLNQNLLITLAKVWSVEQSGQKPGEICMPIDVAFLDSGKLVASEHNNQRLQVFDAKGHSIQVIGEGLVRPRCMAVDREHSHDIAVVDLLDKTIKIFHHGAENPTSLGSHLLGDPHGLAVTSTGKYVVTDLHQDFPKVSIFDPTGKCIRKLGTSTCNSGTHVLQSPGYVTVDQYDRIFVTDQMRHCVKVFDVTGTLIQEFGEMGHENGQLMHPNGIFADCVSNLMIADNGNRRISMFGPAGKFIQQVLVEKDGVRCPEGLAVSAGGHLAIAENAPHAEAIKVYEMK